MILFPSPTGVNYYELSLYSISGEATTGFRPQQGLTIMNILNNYSKGFSVIEFPSPTGVNYYESPYTDTCVICGKKTFPSPTGVNYYEFLETATVDGTVSLFPSPTGVNYYEF